MGTQIVITPDGGHQKMTESCDFNVPGPGTYVANTHIVFRNNGNSKFGTESRPGMDNKQQGKVPAPNAYDRDAKSVVLKSAPSFGFGASKRPQSQGSKKFVPGPGTYPVKTIIGTDSQGKTLAGRYEQARTTNMMAPGPGTYEPNNKPALQASPQWRMGSSKRDDADKLKMRTSNFPPPDSYNPQYTSIKERNASWSFGSGQRAKLASMGLTTPAPGTYSLPSRAVEGPKYPMGSKIDA